MQHNYMFIIEHKFLHWFYQDKIWQHEILEKRGVCVHCRVKIMLPNDPLNPTRGISDIICSLRNLIAKLKFSQILDIL